MASTPLRGFTGSSEPMHHGFPTHREGGSSTLGVHRPRITVRPLLHRDDKRKWETDDVSGEHDPVFGDQPIDRDSFKKLKVERKGEYTAGW